MMKRIIYVMFLMLGFLQSNAQDIQEEMGFVYVKAEYLLETSRYDEAIQEFTAIIKKDPSFKEALYNRGLAKYAVAAYKGAINDVLEAMYQKGVSGDYIALIGKAQYKMGDYKKALRSMRTASELSDDAEVNYYMGEILVSNEEEQEACEYYYVAASYGHTMAKKRLEVLCGQYEQKNDSPKDKSSTNNDSNEQEDDKDNFEDKITDIINDILPGTIKKEEDSKKEPELNDKPNQNRKDDKSSDSNDDEKEETKKESSESEVEKNDDEITDRFINEIVVDEDLTLLIRNGLGSREVIKQPSILVLSEESGEVVIDVCVMDNGRVNFAEFNSEQSSISSQSLVSLAVRKSKEFVFDKSNKEEVCGQIVYQVAGL